MTKEQLIDVVEKAKCKMLNGLNLHSITKEDIVEHLEKSCCPVLKKLCKE